MNLGTPISKESVDEVLRLRKRGLSLDSIAEEIGMSRSSVKRRLDKAVDGDVCAEPVGEFTSIENCVQDMRPTDAVDYLLGVIQRLLDKEPDQPSAFEFFVKLGFTKYQARLCAALHDHMGIPISQLSLMDAVYFDCVGDEPEIKIIDVFICKIRKKLKKIGSPFKISTAWGVGYFMTGDHGDESP